MLQFIIETIDYFQPGGIIMLSIIIISLLMWALIIERTVYFRKLERNDVSLEQAVDILLGKTIEAIDKTALNGLRGRIVANALRMCSCGKTPHSFLLDQCALKELPLLRRHLSTISLFAIVSPLLGLLGTVTGMMTTFDAINMFGTGNVKAMAGGISGALITTQGGLLVAVPGLYMSIYLSLKSNRLENRLAEITINLKHFFENNNQCMITV